MNEYSYIDETENEIVNPAQVIVTGITWSKDSLSKFASKKDFSSKLPEMFTFDLPATILSQEEKPNYYDIVETFVYNFLMRRFNHIAYRCQIWLPIK
jgi:hypothetical protein